MTLEEAPIVDCDTRSHMAVLLRRFATGRISYAEFEAEWPQHSFDPVLKQVFHLGIWPFVDENDDEIKRPLAPEQKRFVARIILFLKTDYPYKWPSYEESLFFGVIGDLCQSILFLFTLGLVRRPNAIRLPRGFKNKGSLNVWPFISESDYETALGSPKYLSGRGRQHGSERQ